MVRAELKARLAHTVNSLRVSGPPAFDVPRGQINVINLIIGLPCLPPVCRLPGLPVFRDPKFCEFAKRSPWSEFEM